MSIRNGSDKYKYNQIRRNERNSRLFVKGETNLAL